MSKTITAASVLGILIVSGTAPAQETRMESLQQMHSRIIELEKAIKNSEAACAPAAEIERGTRRFIVRRIRLVPASTAAAMGLPVAGGFAAMPGMANNFAATRFNGGLSGVVAAPAFAGNVQGFVSSPAFTSSTPALLASPSYGVSRGTQVVWSPNEAYETVTYRGTVASSTPNAAHPYVIYAPGKAFRTYR